MKTRTTMKSAMCILLAVGMLLSSCKKKDEATPRSFANIDNLDMGTTSAATVNVLANDNYSGNVSITINSPKFGTYYTTDYGTLVINTDNSITFTSRTNFYGTATVKYTIQDDNGYTTGDIVIHRGTDAQIKTYDIISSFKTKEGLFCYAINGDSSRIYTNNYDNYSIGYTGFDQDKLQIFTQGYIPDMLTNPYIILSEGSLSILADNNTTVILQVVDYFTASAKKRDGSGQHMTVSGYTLKHGTDVLDFTTRID